LLFPFFSAILSIGILSPFLLPLPEKKAKGFLLSRTMSRQKQQMLLQNTNTLTRKILSDTACWKVVEAVAQELQNVPGNILQGSHIDTAVSQALLKYMD
jgi:hypothetical protein